LVQLFSEHGKVVDARVVYDRESGRSRGFGFVTMATQDELDDAIAALDGQDDGTQRLEVVRARNADGSILRLASEDFEKQPGPCGCECSIRII